MEFPKCCGCGEIITVRYMCTVKLKRSTIDFLSQRWDREREIKSLEEIENRTDENIGLLPKKFAERWSGLIRKNGFGMQEMVDSFWHDDCLKCDICESKLAEVGFNLYEKMDFIFCQRDYFR